MSTETIEVQKRAGVGSTAAKNLRNAGLVPAILYGHGEDNVNLAIKSEVLDRVIEHGTKVLSLRGEISDHAVLRDVQWDTFGSYVLHVDLLRVSKSELIEVSIPVELHGEAPGANEGGMLSFTTHELSIQCPASGIPEKFEVNIGGLHVGDSIHASDIELPNGASLVTPETEVIVQITQPAAQDVEETAAEDEPEVIGKSDESETPEG